MEHPFIFQFGKPSISSRAMALPWALTSPDSKSIRWDWFNISHDGSIGCWYINADTTGVYIPWDPNVTIDSSTMDPMGVYLYIHIYIWIVISCMVDFASIDSWCPQKLDQLDLEQSAFYPLPFGTLT